MKMLIIGCGGIGSFLIEEMAKKIEQEQIEYNELIHIADDDIVELKQLKYQNFKDDEIGEKKADVLAKRCKALDIKIFKPISERIEKNSQLKDYDYFILCVDNERTRELVINYAHRHNKDFIDLRANGRRIFVMPKEKNISDNLKFVDNKDLTEYSCQDKADLENNRIQLGNKIVALMGVQALMNFQRGHDNRTINMVI